MRSGIGFHRKLDQRDPLVAINAHDTDREISLARVSGHEVLLDGEEGPDVVGVPDSDRDSHCPRSGTNFTKHGRHSSLLMM